MELPIQASSEKSDKEASRRAESTDTGYRLASAGQASSEVYENGLPREEPQCGCHLSG